MLDQATSILWAFLAVGSTLSKAELLERETSIDRCTAVAEMLASAYTTYPDEVQLRTDFINQERKKIEDRLGITDRHLMSAYGALAFYDGKRIAGVIPRSEPINGMHIAAEGAARCMATTFERDAP